ncbi:MAG: hypothetical protein ACHQ15_02915 [Candidatus Limnocylindrales bacterium]
MADRRVGIALLAAGLILVAAAQHLAPLPTPPLYDGVVIAEPYRFLVPAAGQAGDPGSASGTEQLENGQSPLTAIATTEQPPQAQIFAISGTLILPPGTTSIKLSIEPILPAVLPTDGHIAGNVYRISVTNQAGVPLTALVSDNVSVVLRGPDEAASGATIERYADGAWQPLKSDDAGLGVSFIAVVTGFGDFAVVVAGPGGPYPTASPEPGASGLATPSGAASPTAAPTAPPISTPSPSPTPTGSGPFDGGVPTPLLALAGIALVIGGLGGAWWLRRRRAAPARRPPQRRSKRR